MLIKVTLFNINDKRLGVLGIPEDCKAIRWGGSIFVPRLFNSREFKAVMSYHTTQHLEDITLTQGGCDMYEAKGNQVWYITPENEGGELFLTMHPTKDCPLSLEAQAEVMAHTLNSLRKT